MEKMIDALLKALATAKGRKGQVTISTALILGLALIWNEIAKVSEKVADVRERIVRIETKLGIPPAYAKK